MALSYMAVEVLWVSSLAKKVHPTLPCPTLYSNNQVAVKIASDWSSMKCTRHIKQEFHFVNKHLWHGNMKIQWIKGTEQLADALTKALGKIKHCEFCNQVFF